jgi:hypothetical protein
LFLNKKLFSIFFIKNHGGQLSLLLSRSVENGGLAREEVERWEGERVEKAVVRKKKKHSITVCFLFAFNLNR